MRENSTRIQFMPQSFIKLGVNIDHIATLRQARYRDYATKSGQYIEPDPIMAAMIAERGGADGITVHLREDRRHIQDIDLKRLRESIQTRINLEMACTDEMEKMALDLCPESVCLVPENRDEVTTEGGLDVFHQSDRIRRIIASMQKVGIRTSLFIDSEIESIEKAAELKADMIELHTGAFANAYYDESAKESAWRRLYEAAEYAHRCGLIVNAGHGINYTNIKDIRTLPYLNELNIGHSIISRALFVGIEDAVRVMKQKMQGRD